MKRKEARAGSLEAIQRNTFDKMKAEIERLRDELSILKVNQIAEIAAAEERGAESMARLIIEDEAMGVSRPFVEVDKPIQNWIDKWRSQRGAK
jgi:hypothetical protein